MKPKPDLRFEDHGSIVLMYPETPEGRAWVAEHIPEDAPRWGRDGIVIESRYVEDIIRGAQDDGLWAAF